MKQEYPPNVIKRLRVAEEQINKHLFRISAIITLIVMGFFLVQFFTRGAFPPHEMGVFYVGVVLVYALHKEMVRWMGDERKSQKQGEMFVYGWIGLTTLLYIVNFFSKDYFSYSTGGEAVRTLTDITSIALQVFVIFIITRALKLFNVLSRKKARTQ